MFQTITGTVANFATTRTVLDAECELTVIETFITVSTDQGPIDVMRRSDSWLDAAHRIERGSAYVFATIQTPVGRFVESVRPI